MLNIKRRWMPYLFAYASKFMVRLLLSTCRIEVKGLSHLKKTADSSPCIVMLWHNRLVLVSELLTKLTDYAYAPLISKSRDGDALAILAHSYPKGRALRVAHTARHCALTQVISTLKKQQNVVIITPDGPRGPCYSVKPGISMAAREAEAKIIPFSWKASSEWELGTWDHIRIPKPFSTIEVEFGPSISLSNEKGTPQGDAAILHRALMNLEMKPDIIEVKESTT